jgi:hypothetical protein
MGSLIRAWHENLNSLYPDVDITFFGCTSDGLKELKLNGKTLVAESTVLREVLTYTSNGEEFIDLSKYDVFLVYGLQARPYFTNTNTNFYSKSVVERSIKDICENTLSIRIVNLIREAVNNKIFVGHSPLLASNKSDANEKRSPSGISSYYDGVKCLNDKFYSLINAELIAQDQKTISENGRNSLSKYSIGSKRLDYNSSHATSIRLHPKDDYGHMNDDFGKIWLESFLNNSIVNQT